MEFEREGTTKRTNQLKASTESRVYLLACSRGGREKRVERGSGRARSSKKSKASDSNEGAFTRKVWESPPIPPPNFNKYDGTTNTVNYVICFKTMMRIISHDSAVR